ncbi:MAG: efflux RND transporter periplasmic adaptor subunit [Planctomycetota bacterium]
MKKLLILIASVVLLVVLAMTLWSSSTMAASPGGEPGEGELFTLERGDLVILLTEDGTLVAKESKKVRAEFRGQAKITFLIEEGKVVEEGEVLCKLDSTQLEKEVDQLELDIVQGEANLETSQTQIEIQKLKNQGDLETARNELEKARQNLEKYRDGDAPQDRRRLEIDIKDSETDFRRSKKRYEDSKMLLAQNFIKNSELEDHQILYERALVNKQGAELAIKLFDKYTYPMTLVEKETAFNKAKRDLTATEKRVVSELRQKEVAHRRNKKRLEGLKKRYEDRKKDIANMTLKAPCPGIVIYGDPRQPWRAQEVKVGGTVWGRNTVMTIPDLRVMQAKIQVHEADINKLEVGQAAKVTMDTYPGLVLNGKVSKIASVAGGGSNPWSYSLSSVKKFGVEVTLENGDKELKLKPGISAKVEIYIDKRPDALFVPLQCVFIQDGEHLTYVRGDDGKPVARKLEIGLSNDSYVEILDGLEEGDRVLLYNPNLPTTKDEEAEGSKEEGKPADAAAAPATRPTGTG